MSATTDRGATARAMLAQLPRGARFFASAWDTTAGGSDRDEADERRREATEEIRVGCRDESVGHVTVIVLYEE